MDSMLNTQYAITNQIQSLYSIPSLPCASGYALEPAPANNTGYVTRLGCQHALGLYTFSDMQARCTPIQTLVRSHFCLEMFRNALTLTAALALRHMPCLWLCVSNSGRRRLRCGKQLHELDVPSIQWFDDVVRNSCEPNFREKRSEHQLHALLRWEAGSPWTGWLTDWSPQARLLQEYYVFPTDSFIMRVQDVRFLRDPHQYPLSKKIAATSHVFYQPGGEMSDLSSAAIASPGGLRVQTLLQTWGETDCIGCPEWIPCLTLPAVFVELLEKGVWKDLLGLARWSPIARSIPEEWDLQPGHEEPMAIDQLELHLSKFLQHANDLRRWKSAIVARHGEQELLSLEQSVRYFEGCALALRGGRGHMKRVALNRQQPGVARGPGTRAKVYDTLVLIEVMRMSRVIKGDNILFVLKSAVNTVFPHVLQRTLSEMTERTMGAYICPSKTSRHACRLMLDMSLNLLEREQVANTAKTVLRYDMADSSTQCSRDWLMCRYDRIFLEDLGELVVAANSLIALNDRARLLGPDAVDQRDHARLLSVLRRGIVKFYCTPIALGRGHTSLADKASALVFCWAVLLGGDMPSLQRFLSSFVAMTSDMGVEMGLSDFRLLSVKKLLPAYMVSASFDVDTMVVDNADKDAHDVVMFLMKMFSWPIRWLCRAHSTSSTT